ncbi:MAG: hypothetical protein ACRDRW_16345 [Pseudonocardiaceae bacterium]
MRTALTLPESRTLALAGGGAMIAHGFVTRLTKDIDLFTEVDDHEAIQVVVALRRALQEQGLVTRDTERPPLDHRFFESRIPVAVGVWAISTHWPRVALRLLLRQVALARGS